MAREPLWVKLRGRDRSGNSFSSTDWPRRRRRRSEEGGDHDGVRAGELCYGRWELGRDRVSETERMDGSKEEGNRSGLARRLMNRRLQTSSFFSTGWWYELKCHCLGHELEQERDESTAEAGVDGPDWWNRREANSGDETGLARSELLAGNRKVEYW